MRILALLLFASTAFAQTNETQYVDWSTGCGGNDGTVGNPYCSCQEWEDQNRNLVTEDVNLTVEFTGNPTSWIQCTFSGWTTDSTRRILLNGMTFTTTAYGMTFTVSVNNLTIRNAVVVRNGAGTNSQMMDIGSGVTGFLLEKSIFGLGPSWSRDSGVYGVRLQGSGTIRNTILYNFPDSPLNVPLTAGKTFSLYNNTVIASGNTGILIEVSATPTGTTINLENNIVQGAASSDYNVTTSSATYNNSNNISEDATSPQSLLRNIALTFEDAANRNYRLSASDTDAIDAGTTIGSFSDDIDGTTRPSGAAWDIGAHEYISAATTQLPVLQAIGAL